MAENIFKRYECKYLITEKQRQNIEQDIQTYLKPDPYFISDIRNVYYDTPDYKLIRKSLEKPEYKEKIRLRSYGKANGQDRVFLELKKKYEGIVYKRRLELSYEDAQSFLDDHEMDLPDTQIGKEIEYFVQYYKSLKPSIYLSYTRESYMGIEDSNIRLTFDHDICFRNTDMNLCDDPEGIYIIDSDQCLMEIKVPYAIPLWLVKILSENGVYQTSFSKYGTVYEHYLTGGKQYV